MCFDDLEHPKEEVFQVKVAIFHNLPSGGAKRALYEIVIRLPLEWLIDVYTLSTSDDNFCDLANRVNLKFTFRFSPGRLFNSPFGRLNQFQRWRDLLRLNRISRKISDRREGTLAANTFTPLINST